MIMQHTEGRLRQDAAVLRIARSAVGNTEIEPVIAVALCEEWRELGDPDGPMPETMEEAWANAKHLAACWNACDEIHRIMDGTKWGPGTLAEIADAMKRAGFVLRDPAEVA